MSRLAIALFASLALNLLLVGTGVGLFLAQRERPTIAEPGLWRGGPVRDAMRALPEERRAALRGQMAEAWRGAAAERAAVREARRRLGEIVAAEPYDAEAVRAGFATLRDAEMRHIEKLHEGASRAFETLPVEERRALLEAIARGRGGKGGGHGGHGERGDRSAPGPER